MSTVTAEKKAAARAKKLASLRFAGRAFFKATNATLIAVHSSEKTYHVTLLHGKCSSCIDSATGEPCKAHEYGRTTCCHSDFALIHEAKYGVLQARKQEELAVAEEILGAEMTSELTAHLEDGMPAQALPVVVRMLEGLNVYVITTDDRYECVPTADLSYFYPEHREATDDEVMYLNSAEGPMRQGRQVVRASYRDMYADDFNGIAS